jgi:hypothetical protein
MRNDLTQEQVRRQFTYSPKEGLLRYRNPTVVQGKIVPPGTIAGHVHKEGYRYVSVNGVQYRGSRVIWLYVTGQWPVHKIDHKDCNPTNDKFENLREASDSQQKQNNRKRKDSKTGYKCVTYYEDPRYRDGKHYRWKVVVNGKRIKSSQRYFTAKEAYEAYCAKLVEFHGEFANDGEA